jgi:hypothetical protein
MKKVVNWTSAKVPMWQMDCQNFWRAGLPFEVRNVSEEEDVRFIETFASSHSLNYVRNGETAYFDTPGFALDNESESGADRAQDQVGR